MSSYTITLLYPSLSPLVQLYNNPQPAAPDRRAEGEGAGTSSQDQELSRVFPRPGLGRSQNQGLESPLTLWSFRLRHVQRPKRELRHFPSETI